MLMQGYLRRSADCPRAAWRLGAIGMVSSSWLAALCMQCLFVLALVDMFDLTLWLDAGLEVLAARSSALEDHSPRQASRFCFLSRHSSRHVVVAPSLRPHC